jgi:hypothetical protein
MGRLLPACAKRELLRYEYSYKLVSFRRISAFNRPRSQDHEYGTAPLDLPIVTQWPSLETSLADHNVAHGLSRCRRKRTGMLYINLT